jgi:hypothetical protein
MPITRREWVAGHLVMSVFPGLAMPRARAVRRTCLIAAPSNLGLRPSPSGAIPGTWRAPEVLLNAGLARALDAVRVDLVDRMDYDTHEQTGSRIRNGHIVRADTSVSRLIAGTRFGPWRSAAARSGCRGGPDRNLRS